MEYRDSIKEDLTVIYATRLILIYMIALRTLLHHLE